MNRIILSLVMFTSVELANAAPEQICESDSGRHATQFDGTVTGKQQFTRTVGEKWLFTLEPDPFGWNIRLRDTEGMDLSQITPPFRMAPNPREIYGWHFRNSANTGTNKGYVNAPQRLRVFQFSPSLSGTGGFRPPSAAGLIEPNPGGGRGILRILDMGLADLEPEKQARMNYLKFNVCLTWPKTEDEARADLDQKSPDFVNADKEIMFGCGLDTHTYKLFAWVMPRIQSADLDKDGTLDTIAPIIRKSDGRKGLAFCRAGTWISVIGYQASADTPLKPVFYSLAQYLNKAEFWEIRQSDDGNDMLVIGQMEKSETAIEWNGKTFIPRLLKHFIEP